MTMRKITKQNDASRQPVRAPRAVLVALLIVLQSFVAIATAAAIPLGGIENFNVLELDPALTCVKQEDQGRAPTPKHDYFKCCILCSAEALIDAALSIVPNDGTVIAPPPALIWVTKPARVASKATRLGWNGACSSRAPPPLS